MNIIEKLRALRAKPEWDDQDRLALVLALSAFMQNVFNSGVPYGAQGIPNMQSLIEVGFMGYGDQDADQLQRLREEILQFIDIELLPFLVQRESGYRTTREKLADQQPLAHPLERIATTAGNLSSFAVVALIVLALGRRFLQAARARAGAA